MMIGRNFRRRSFNGGVSCWWLMVLLCVVSVFMVPATSSAMTRMASRTVEHLPQDSLLLDKLYLKRNHLPSLTTRTDLSLPALSHISTRNTGIQRPKRTSEHLVTDCIHMTSDEGQFYHKASIVDGNACGVFIFAEPDQKIELHFNYIDVPCDNGGLVSFVDGWELNGEFFPSPRDHAKPLGERFSEFCGGNRKVKQVFTSGQNAALVQYRMPARGTSFSFTVRFVKNPTPCHVLLQSTDDIFTLRNYGRPVNCTASAVFPGVVRVAALSVGVITTSGRGTELETGTLHKCQKKGMDDYVEIGGSNGFDSANLQLADAVCGLDSKPECGTDLILCDVTTIRLVSSGTFDNSVTISLREMSGDDISGFVSVNCLGDDKRK